MYIKRYTVAALLLIAFIGLYVYTNITSESMSIDFFGIPLPSFLIALWVVIPAIVLYLASVMHFSFYSLIGSFTLRKYEKDYETMMEALADAYIGLENRHHSFKTERYKLLGELIDNTHVNMKSTFSVVTKNAKLDEVINVIKSIENGEVVDLKKYSLLPTNELAIKNNHNRYNQGVLSAQEILSNSARYDKSLLEQAYSSLVATSSLKDIEEYKSAMNKESLFVILSRVNADENILDISNEKLISLIQLMELDEKDYIEISTVLASTMIPEQRIKLFELLSEKDEDAMGGYLYTLFDLEMFSPVDEILENSQPNEFLKFKAYRSLKECNKNYNINLFV
jgi:hypothetical protein